MRSRLALLVLATTGLMMIAFLVPLALLVRQVAEDRATVRATADVQGIVTVVGTASLDAVRLTVERLAAESRRPVTVYLADSSVLGTDVPPTPAVELARRGASLTAGTAGGGREIVIAVQGRPEGTAVIRTEVSAAEASSGVTRSWLVLAGLGVLLSLVGLAVADRLARSLVRPITALSTVSHRLANAELTARAEPAGPPELRDVAGALNHLAGRIQELLRQEREHVADLSHRLRTPLTVLRLEAESLRDPQEGARLTAAADALERAVTGLIRQARSATTDAGRSDAAAVVADRAEFWAALAEDTQREMTVDLAPGPLPVGLPAEDLAAAVDALLGNVFAHTPDETPFTVRLTARATGGAVLTVADRGPGVPAGLVRRGASGADSTGLGLDICRRAAQASGGRLEITAGEPSGAVMVLHLGPPRP
ncbi:HAMP domain-containing sensor histidine kinase [Paractinoplanes rishiriensis]|uniref:histidine kinase n=1 Tax=Paractinoplanes rishiriensis TaxID=1050105 RepID=A0A919K862_9ACTN|nr:HAMP domain-containing sensor histidine kinase [Actinoplanes rishiriensis]GIF00528.1 two-component sensor histidine kinase [Actinoplanes rishiriensis]